MMNWCVWWREMRRRWNRVLPQWEKKTELLPLLNVNQILRWEFHLSGFKKSQTDFHQFKNFGVIFWLDSEIFSNVLETLRVYFVLKITSNLTESQSLDILGEVWVCSGLERKCANLWPCSAVGLNLKPYCLPESASAHDFLWQPTYSWTKQIPE